MNIRMTLTAIALGSMALAGCGSMGTSTAPAATAPAVTAPAAMAPKENLATPSGTDKMVGDPLLQDQSTQTMESRTGYSNPSLIKTVDGPKDGDPLLQDQSTATLDSQYSNVETVVERTTTVETVDSDPLLQNQGRETPDSRVVAGDAMMKDMAGDDTMMMKDMAGGDTMMMDNMAGDDVVMNACVQAGGQVVNWVGDPSGETQACRREDGLEYRLSDAQYYQ